MWRRVSDPPGRVKDTSPPGATDKERHCVRRHVAKTLPFLSEQEQLAFRPPGRVPAIAIIRRLWKLAFEIELLSSPPPARELDLPRPRPSPPKAHGSPCARATLQL